MKFRMLCECEDMNCMSYTDMELDDEDIIMSPYTFFLLRAHIGPEDEVVRDLGEGWVIVRDKGGAEKG